MSPKKAPSINNLFTKGEISPSGKAPGLRHVKATANSNFSIIRFDWRKFNLVKWPIAVLIWSLVGMLVSINAAPEAGDIFVTTGQSLSIPLAMLFGIAVGVSLTWLIFRVNMSSVRLYSEYLSRQRQLYRASKTARKKLLKSWGDQL